MKYVYILMMVSLVIICAYAAIADEINEYYNEVLMPTINIVNTDIEKMSRLISEAIYSPLLDETLRVEASKAYKNVNEQYWIIVKSKPPLKLRGVKKIALNHFRAVKEIFAMATARDFFTAEKMSDFFDLIDKAKGYTFEIESEYQKVAREFEN
ncbi:hypothetical protein ACFL0T_07335 [Candidatus Omnitrophota bacterium]